MKKYLALLATAALILSCGKNGEDDIVPAVPETSPEESCMVPGVAEVYFSEEMIELIENDLVSGNLRTKSSDLNSLVEDLGITSMERVFPYDERFEGRTRREGMHRWYTVRYESPKTATKAASDMAQLPGIDIAEPVRETKIMAEPAFFDDPQYKKQWHYHNDGTLSSKHRAGADINVLPVWKNYTTGSSKVTVAVIDGGIDQRHEDLSDACIGGRNFCGSSSGIVAHDHGTHVAGTIGAINNNGIGVNGIAGGDAKKGVKGVRLLSAQIFQDGKSGGSGATALKWACDNGANLANNSWGYDFEGDYEAAKYTTLPSSMRQAIDYFIKYAGCDDNGNQLEDSPMKGGLVFFAAGNDGWDTDPIGKYEPVISVGSIAPDFTRAYYSNYGPWVDICAPGGSAYYASGQVLSTVPDNKYDSYQGTSMACPHATGVAALVLSWYGGPGFTAEDLKEKILGGSNPTAVSENAMIGRLVDAYGAITYGNTYAPDPVENAEVSVQANSIALTFKVTADEDDQKAYAYRMVATKDASLLDELDPADVPSGIHFQDTEVGNLSVGQEITARVENLDFETSYIVAVFAYDYSGHFSGMSPIYSAETATNNPPEIHTDYNGDFIFKAHEKVTIRYTVTDPDGHSMTIKVAAGSNAAEFTKVDEGIYDLKLTGPKSEPGTYTASISATDKYGKSTSLTIPYTFLENHPPIVKQPFEDIFSQTIGEKFTLNMKDYIYDPDGETLSWKTTISQKDVFHTNINDDILIGTVLGNGSVTVSLTASDAMGCKQSGSFRVFVKAPEDLVEAYPNPCTDHLTIRTGNLRDTRVMVISENGKTAIDQTEKISAFEPLTLDTKPLAPGKYLVRVYIEGEDMIEKHIVKL